MDKFNPLRKVQCKVEVFSLNAIDQVEHLYSAGVYVQLRVPSSQMPKGIEQMEKLSVEFMNLRSADRDKRTYDNCDGFVCQHIVVVGDWCSPFNLKNFPLDVQQLKVQFEVWNADDMDNPLIPEPYGESIAKGFYLEDMFALKPKVDEYVEVISDVPTFTMSMTISRIAGFYTLNYVVPISLMSSLCFCMLGIDDTEVGDRLTVVLTLLLTVVAYKMALSSSLPVMNAMCLLDKYLAGVFITMFVLTILVSMGSEQRPWIDLTIRMFAMPWVIFNLYVAWRLAKYARMRDGTCVHEDYVRLM